MIFVQGESSIEAQGRITNVFMGLLPNEDMAREYLKEASRDLSTLGMQNLVNINPKTFSTPLYDFDSIANIKKTIKKLESRLAVVPKQKQTFIGQWKESSNPVRCVWIFVYACVGIFLYLQFSSL